MRNADLTLPIDHVWHRQLFYLNPPGEAGKDCLKLNFSINSDGYLQVNGIDLRTGIHLKTKILGLIN